MRHAEALAIAERVVEQLQPHCERIEIAGSLRRERLEVGDIEIVAIPKPYEVGLFESGIATVVNQWPKVKGELPCKYTQRVLPEGIKLDLFFARDENWGLIFAIRTGSADYSHKVLASRWAQLGYESRDGMLHNPQGHPIPIYSEAQLFSLLGLTHVPPFEREVNTIRYRE